MPLVLVIAIQSSIDQVPEQIPVNGKIYTPRALYCYSGNGTYGHYYAYIKGTNGWNLCDDQLTSNVPNIPQRGLSSGKFLICELI